MTTKEIKKQSGVEKALAKFGINHEEELEKDLVALGDARMPDIPYVVIDHSKMGDHRLIFDFGDSYLGKDSQQRSVPDNKLSGVIFAWQDIRVWFEDGAKLPTCAAVKDVPTVDTPKSDGCTECPYNFIKLTGDRAIDHANKWGLSAKHTRDGESSLQSPCKSKVRLWMVSKIDNDILPLVMLLPPTSLKHWRSRSRGKPGHLNKLIRSKRALIATETIIGLEPQESGGFRWAEVVFDADLTTNAPTELIEKAKEARQQLEAVMSQLSQQDFGTNGNVADEKSGDDDFNYGSNRTEPTDSELSAL